jgi:predicted GNAT family acetyltransferase
MSPTPRPPRPTNPPSTSAALVPDHPVIINDTTRDRFELMDGDEVIAFATYVVDGGTVVIHHVETTPSRRRNGHAAELMAGVLDQIRRTGRTVTPVCSYALAYLQDHPDQHDLLA